VSDDNKSHSAFDHLVGICHTDEAVESKIQEYLPVIQSSLRGLYQCHRALGKSIEVAYVLMLQATVPPDRDLSELIRQVEVLYP